MFGELRGLKRWLDYFGCSNLEIKCGQQRRGIIKHKPHNGGKWTEARKKSFIVGALRRASSRWGPKNSAKATARVRRGEYECALCKTLGPATLPPEKDKKRRRNNAAADHINPVVDPNVGFKDWNTFIDRLFCEEDGFQILCWECHTKVTKEEREVAKLRRAKEKGKDV